MFVAHEELNENGKSTWFKKHTHKVKQKICYSSCLMLQLCEARQIIFVFVYFRKNLWTLQNTCIV